MYRVCLCARVCTVYECACEHVYVPCVCACVCVRLYRVCECVYVPCMSVYIVHVCACVHCMSVRVSMRVYANVMQTCVCVFVRARLECLEHNHDKSTNCNFGIFEKMDVLQHNLAGAQSCYVQSTS